MVHAEHMPSVDASPRESVGALLRSNRQHHGLEIAQVAEALRIRLTFLQAIEEGRHQDLPGPTYAVGFVRAYADYLGLDGGEIVRRYKEETSIVPRKAELEFPTPVSEGGLPTGAMILMAAVIGAVVYGGWYWMSTEDRSMAELIQDVPERFSSLLTSAPDAPPATEAEAPPSAAEPAPAPAPAPVAEAPATPPVIEAPVVPEAPAAAPVEPEAPAAEEPAAVSPEGETTTQAQAEALAVDEDPVVPPAEEEDEPAAAPEPTPQVAQVPPTAPVQPPAPAPAAPSASAPSAPAEPPAAPAQQTAAVPAAPALAVPPVPASGAVYGAPAGSTRVVLAARDDTWIQVRAGEELVATRLLRRGERFQVPDRDGMTLMVGNAAGLQIQVDGKPLPALGAQGEVRRGIRLDADRLLAP